MDDFTNAAELAQVTQKSPVLAIIEQHVLARTCILNILKRELAGFEIVEMATTNGLSWFAGRDIRLIALNIGDKEITDPAIEVSLAFIAEFFSQASVALLSNREDEATISQRCTGGSVASFRPPSRSKSRLPACVSFSPAESTGRFRWSDTMARLMSRTNSLLPELPSIYRYRAKARAGEEPDRFHASGATRARGIEARSSQQIDCRQAESLGKHRQDAYSPYHAEMCRSKSHRGDSALERPMMRARLRVQSS